MRKMKIRTLADLEKALEIDIKAYNDFVKIYGYDVTAEQKLKYRAISSLHSEIPFIIRIDDILDNLINKELFEDWNDTLVYHYMIRWLENNTNVDDKLVKRALNYVKEL